MISFDQNEFWIIYAKYTNRYLLYISECKEIADHEMLTEDGMIRFQEIGPFRLESPPQMQSLIQVLLAIIFKEMQDTKELRDLKAKFPESQEELSLVSNASINDQLRSFFFKLILPIGSVSC